jgi:hypothetical protein
MRGVAFYINAQEDEAMLKPIIIERDSDLSCAVRIFWRNPKWFPF